MRVHNNFSLCVCVHAHKHCVYMHDCVSGLFSSQLSLLYSYRCTFCIADGHHKLVRWRIVTHCGIDGYSRVVVYMHSSTNNRASTVYDLFLRAVELYGLPSRVRCDQGTENIHVARHMLRHRGVERRSVLVGSSVHNQRLSTPFATTLLPHSTPRMKSRHRRSTLPHQDQTKVNLSQQTSPLKHHHYHVKKDQSRHSLLQIQVFAVKHWSTINLTD